MDSFELNKIVAAVLMVALLVIGIGKLADVIFYVEKPKTPGYAIEVEQAIATSAEKGSLSNEKKMFKIHGGSRGQCFEHFFCFDVSIKHFKKAFTDIVQVIRLYPCCSCFCVCSLPSDSRVSTRDCSCAVCARMRMHKPMLNARTCSKRARAHA